MIPLLSVDRLSIEFDTGRGVVRALENVSMSVDRGEILGVVGESGSGKSVLSLAILDLLDRAARITGGSIIFKGKDTRATRNAMENVRGRDMSMVFQSPRTSLNPIRSIGRQIMDVLQRHREIPREAARAEALAALERVGILDAPRRFDAYPFELSGGMCQRALIAAALACKPSLLLADEPTTGLDVTTQAAVMDLIRDLVNQSGMAVVLVTHDLALAAEYCDRIMVMHAGHVVESARSTEIMARPAHPYTRRLMRATPVPGSRLEDLVAIPGRFPDLHGLLAACRFETRCERARPECSLPLEPSILRPGHSVLCRFPG